MKLSSELELMRQWADRFRAHLDAMVRQRAKLGVPVIGITFDEETPSELGNYADQTNQVMPTPNHPVSEAAPPAETDLGEMWVPSRGSIAKEAAAHLPTARDSVLDVEVPEEGMPRNLAFVFMPSGFYLTIDLFMLTPREARRLARTPKFFWLRDHRWPHQSLEKWEEEVADCEPLQKEYAGVDTRTAAEDAAWIFFGLWSHSTCPCCNPIYFRKWSGTAGLRKETAVGVVWDVPPGSPSAAS
ncbi:MAG: hypothetical protein K8T25_23040 [Planctomycetia bacterium]|nr:hypothetical protein [Planctomycetia bacterium]